jgi:hypothetical protein
VCRITRPLRLDYVRLKLARPRQQLRQLGDVRRDPPRLVADKGPQALEAVLDKLTEFAARLCEPSQNAGGSQLSSSGISFWLAVNKPDDAARFRLFAGATCRVYREHQVT